MYEMCIRDRLPTSPDAAMQGYWKNDEDEIMCKTEAAANALADFLTAAGLDICTCCYNADLGVDKAVYKRQALHLL